MIHSVSPYVHHPNHTSDESNAIHIPSMKQHNRNFKVYNVLSFRRLHVHMHAYVTIINLCQFETKKEKKTYFIPFFLRQMELCLLLILRDPLNLQQGSSIISSWYVPKTKQEQGLSHGTSSELFVYLCNANSRKLIFNQLGLGGDISYAIIFTDAIYVFSTFSLFFIYATFRVHQSLSRKGSQNEYLFPFFSWIIDNVITSKSRRSIESSYLHLVQWSC